VVELVVKGGGETIVAKGERGKKRGGEKKNDKWERGHLEHRGRKGEAREGRAGKKRKWGNWANITLQRCV